jgi:hypothetical protein
MARPRLDIDPRQVEQLAAIGCSGDEIAAVIGCSRDLIYKRFSTVLKEGHEKRNASVRRAQYEVGVKNKNAVMLIFLGKQFLGQSDKVEQTGTMKHEHINADEDAILAASEEIRFRRLIGDVGPVEPSGVHEGDVPSV